MTILWALCAAPVFAEENSSEPAYNRYTVIMHLHSLVSPQGKRTLHAIAALASNAGVDVMIPADHYVKRWEYGLPPLSGILRTSLYQTCVMKFGAKNYLNMLGKIRNMYPDLLVIPGLEVTPSYYWSGHWAKANLTLHEFQRHLLVIGLKKVEDVENLPVLSHPRLGKIPWKKILPPAALIATGLALMIRWPAGLFVVCLGALWLLNQRPFRRMPDAFQNFSRNGYDAAQAVIDYTNEKDGIAVWAHPEAPNWIQPQKLFRSVRVQSAPYPEALIETRGYTGFAHFWEGDNKAGGPGGTWDDALRDYCAGKRAAPVWAFAELDWISETQQGLTIKQAQNVVWAKEKTEPAIMEALRAGRFYATAQNGQHEFVLTDWSARSSLGAAMSGEEIAWSADLYLRISFYGTVGKTHGNPQRFMLRILRNGEVIHEKEYFTGAAIAFGVQRPDNPRDYYRLLLREEGYSFVTTNPIFIKKDIMAP